MKKIVSLLSGGLDSPVALYLMIKKGYEPICLSFLTSDDIERSMNEKVIEIVRSLAKTTKRKIKLYIINHDSNLDSFKDNCDRKLTCVLCKRLMIRIAKEIGKNEGTNLIVTGDILGEQASQTLDNLFSYNNVLEESIILRPLIGLNKLDVIKLNEEIGVYEICSQKSAGCQYNPQFPETHAKINEVMNAESR
ncbi:MAG: tRNA 4-thiouridine(8) synthase ThiI, partial [archaeon]|nr:tRNA 4-thiouridine(8) synthase ThiI [archaeon]